MPFDVRGRSAFEFPPKDAIKTIERIFGELPAGSAIGAPAKGNLSHLPAPFVIEKDLPLATAAFKWVNTGLGNTKGSITGTCRSCDARHAPRYLASYEYRYNRRFDLPKMIERLTTAATHTGPRQAQHQLASFAPGERSSSWMLASIR